MVAEFVKEFGIDVVILVGKKCRTVKDILKLNNIVN